MGVSVSASYPVIISAIEDKSYDIQYQSGVMHRLVKKIPAGGGKGNAIQWPYWDPTSASDVSAVSEGSDITSTDSTVNASVYITSSEFGKRSMLTYNLAEDATDDIRDQHAEDHGNMHGKNKEEKLLAHFSNFSTSVTATSTTGMTIGTVMKARSLLDAKSVKVPKPYNMVVHPYAWVWFGINTTSDSNYGVQGDLGEDVLDKYHLTTLFGDVRVYSSNFFTISGSVNTAGMFSKDALGLWTPRKFKLEAEKDISRRAWELVSTQRFGSAELVDSFGVKMSLYAGTPS